MKLWIARDKDGSLWLYGKKPELSEDIVGVWDCSLYGEFVKFFVLPSEYFPEVTFENSPQIIELKLVEK